MRLFIIRYKYVLVSCIGFVLVGMALAIWWCVVLTKPDNLVVPKAVRPTVSAAHSKNSAAIAIAPTKKDKKQIVIDVKGSVYRPGVYTFTKEPIVQNVLDKAGGVLPGVNLVRLNLAAMLRGGQVLYVPMGEEQLPDPYELPGGKTELTMDSSTIVDETGTEKIALNTATITDLMTLPGIGEKRASDIITYRDSKGGFQKMEELRDISGIGEKTFNKLVTHLTLG